MKLCIIGEFPPPMGGMAIQAQLFSEYLKEEGFNVNIVKRNSELGWLNQIPLLRGLLRFIVFTNKIIAIVVASDTLLIFSNSFLNYYLYTIPPLIIGKLLRKQVIMYYHGGAAERFFIEKKHIVARRSLNLANKIIVSSGYLKDVFSQIGVKTEIVPNIISFKEYYYKIKDNPAPRFIVTRHLEPIYNIEMVIRAFQLIAQKYSQAILYICGKGSEEEKLKKLVKDLNLEEKVKFLGEVNNKEIASKYNEADIFLNGSKVDNLPVAILEAFASGLPVVSTDAGGIKYIIKNGQNGLLVEVNDYKDMAEQVERLLQDNKLFKNITKNAYETLKEYSWENVKTKILPILGQ